MNTTLVVVIGVINLCVAAFCFYVAYQKFKWPTTTPNHVKVLLIIVGVANLVVGFKNVI